jgi:hypothetical protein
VLCSPLYGAVSGLLVDREALAIPVNDSRELFLGLVGVLAVGAAGRLLGRFSWDADALTRAITANP